ncbi:MAG: dinitrogenase iron-molybdenum cofactor biosynthesis protein, partial [Candidatus Anammoximicrobium sp.]|nr:dinitrogenase iron-molybdenum cofactor biosynthesis protein [Candidatus Anammoximicrobium sp.]
MRIAVTATGATLESPLDPRFGRCPYFLLVETDDLQFEAVANPNVSRDSGAGIQAAQLVADKGVRFVVTGNCGPNAYQTLSAAGVGVIVGCSGTVRDVVEQFKADRYMAAGQPNVASHFGVGAAVDSAADSYVSPSAKSGFVPAASQGPGRAGGGLGAAQEMGRGGGMGRGMARGGGGMGMGRGMGRGGGGGMGTGRGMGRG